MDLNVFTTTCNYLSIIFLGIACYYCIQTSKLLKEWEEILDKQRNINTEMQFKIPHNFRIDK